jgi:hypothetical protein
MKNGKPDQVSLLNIIPVPKAGNLSDSNNYRGISLSSLIAKLYNRMLLNRIRPALDPFLRFNQNGFRQKKRTTVGQILVLRRLIEGIEQNNHTAAMTFIDFWKAFNTIHRTKMMKILAAYGIPERILQAVAAMYCNTRAMVVSQDGDTGEFELLAGVL